MIYLKKTNNNYVLLCNILISFIVAIGLGICPLPYHLTWLMPNFLVLVLIYWTIFTPEIVSIGVVFAISIIIDLLLAKLLGTTCLCLIPVSFFASRLSGKFRRDSTTKKFLIVIALVSVYQVIWLVLQLLLNYKINSLTYWLTIPISVIFWPVSCAILNFVLRVNKFC